MPNIERPPFVDRAAKEFERLASQAREGGQSAEDVISDVLNGIQRLVEDVADWLTGEVDRLGEMAEEQRKRAESQVQGLIDSMGAAAKKAPARGRQVATRVTGRSPAKKKATSKKAPAKRKATSKKAAAKKAPAKKKAASKKAPAKKKAAAKKASS